VHALLPAAVLHLQGITQVFMLGHEHYRQLWGVEGCVLGVAAAGFLLITTLPADSTSSQQQQQQQEPPQHLQQQQQQQDLLHEQERDPTWQEQQQQQQQGSTMLLQDAAAAPDMGAAGSSSSSSFDGCGSSSSSRSSAAVPSALLLVVLGLLLTVVTSPHVLSQLRLGPSKPQLYLPDWQGFRDGVLKAGLAQLPLTSLNSVIAVSHLALQLFPDRAAVQGWRWRPGAVAVSVGVMNLMGCWFGAFPCCHGSGGLAAQYKFGARTGLAPVLLGGMKLVLALLFGSSLLQLLQHFPAPLLGALLLISGLELAASARKETQQRGYVFMLLTAASILGLRNTAVGFAVGMGAYVGGLAHSWARQLCWQRWWRQRQQLGRHSYVLIGKPAEGGSSSSGVAGV
jgi:hypothetical protein